MLDLKKTFPFYLIFMLCMTVVFGQDIYQKQRDSLNNLIEEAETKESKIEMLNNAYKFFSRNKPKLAQEYLQEGISLAKESNDIEQQLKFMASLGFTYMVERKYQKAIDIYTEGKEFTKKNHLEEKELDFVQRIASAHQRGGNIDLAISLLDSILPIAKQKTFIKVEGVTITTLGRIERDRGNYQKSLNCFKRNLEIAQQIGHKGQIVYSLQQIGIIYQITKDYHKSIEINRKGILVAKEIKHNVRLFELYNNMATSFRKLKIFDSAFYYHFLVLENSKERANKYELASAYMNIGTTYSYQKKYQKSKIYYDSSYQLIKNKKDSWIWRSIIQNYSFIYLKMNQYQKSLDYGYSAIQALKEKKQYANYASAYENIYQAHKALNHYDSALFYYEKITAIRDSLFSKEKEINTEKSKRELENAQNKIVIIDLAKKNEDKEFYLYTFLWGVLIIVLGGLSLLREQNRKKIVAEKNQKIEEQKIVALINEQEAKVANSMLEGQEKERQKIAEEIHDSLGSSLATLKLHTENLIINKKLTEETKSEIIKKIDRIIDETYKKTRQLSHVKSTSFVVQQGLLKAIERLAKYCVVAGKVKVNVEVFGFEKLTNDSLKVFLYHSVQELLANALKHSKATEVQIQISQFDNNLNMIVEDDGIGFNYSSKSIKSGMGLYNIKKKVEKLGGNFDVDSVKGRGTIVNINILV